MNKEVLNVCELAVSYILLYSYLLVLEDLRIVFDLFLRRLIEFDALKLLSEVLDIYFLCCALSVFRILSFSGITGLIYLILLFE